MAPISRSWTGSSPTPGASRPNRARPLGWYDVSTLKEPYRLEGKKTMGYELAEQLEWRLPDWIVYPTGGGTGLIGMWKAFEELEALGWIRAGGRPRMVTRAGRGMRADRAGVRAGAGSRRRDRRIRRPSPMDCECLARWPTS